MANAIPVRKPINPRGAELARAGRCASGKCPNRKSYSNSQSIQDAPSGVMRPPTFRSPSHVEDVSFKLGKAASSGHTVKALAIVEDLRAATFGNNDKPKHVV